MCQDSWMAQQMCPFIWVCVQLGAWGRVAFGFVLIFTKHIYRKAVLTSGRLEVILDQSEFLVSLQNLKNGISTDFCVVQQDLRKDGLWLLCGCCNSLICLDLEMESLATWIVVTRTEMNVSILPWTLNLKNAVWLLAVSPVQCCVPEAYPHWMAWQPVLILSFLPFCVTYWSLFLHVLQVPKIQQAALFCSFPMCSITSFVMWLLC